MKMKYTEQAVETLDDAGSVIANKNIEIEQLRQRVAELEEERDSAYKIADHYRAERDELLAAMIHIQQVACSGSPELGIATSAIASVKEKV